MVYPTKAGGSGGSRSGAIKYKYAEFDYLNVGGAPIYGIMSNDTIHYVDAHVSASGDGLSWANAYKTIKEAVEEVRDDYTDDAYHLIFVAPGEYSEYDIRVYGHGIHIVGLGQPGTDSGVSVNYDSASGTYGIWLLGGANCGLYNMQFEATSALPICYGLAWDNSIIRNCTFMPYSANTTTYGIQIYDVRGSIIEGCTFGVAGNSFATAAIGSEAGADQYLINCLIRDNYMDLNATGSKGIFIHNQIVTYGTVIDRNFIDISGGGSTSIGIDNNATGVVFITDNYVLAATSATPIESASSPTGMLHNHTMAGSTVVDPNTVAS